MSGYIDESYYEGLKDNDNQKCRYKYKEDEKRGRTRNRMGRRSTRVENEGGNEVGGGTSTFEGRE